MKHVEVVARSEAQALAKAANKLGVPVEDVEIIEEYEPDTLDLENLAKEEESASEEEKQGEPVLYVVQMSLKRAVEGAREWVQGLIERFQPGASIEMVVEGEGLTAVVEAPDPSIFIGKGGHTLAALQHVVTRVVPRRVENCPPVQLDVGDYRDRKKEQLERLAESAARRALKTRKNVSLKPMPSTDRKFIHNILKGFKGIATASYGQEPRRYIVVEVAGGEKGGRPGGRDRGDRGRGHARGDRGDRGGRGQADGNRAPRKDFAQPKRSFQPPPPGEIDRPAHYSDVDIEEKPSRLFTYKEKDPDDSVFDPNRPMVDELIDGNQLD